MLLQRLKEYDDRLEPLPPMYKKQPVPWLVELDKEGKLLGFTATSGGGKKDKGKLFLVPDPGVRSSNIKPSLLVDKAEYALGVYKDKKSLSRHQAFLEELKNCAESTGEAMVQTVYHFLTSDHFKNVNIPDEITPESYVAFMVDGCMVSDLSVVKEYWATVNVEDKQNKDKYQCLICGTNSTPARIHPKIKPIPGGQSAGLNIISANSEAFTSYGLEQSYIAPTCQKCAEAYARGANDLLKSGSDCNLVVGPVVYIFWTKEKVESPFLSLLTDPKPEPAQVKKLLKSAFSGQIHDAFDNNAFYAAALSSGNARVVVRDWVETTVNTAKKNLGRWFNLQRLIGYNQEENYYGVFELALSLYPQAGKGRLIDKIDPNVPKAILNVALKGGSLPSWLLFQAVKRNRAEQRVTRPRLALIKMVLLSKQTNVKEEELVQLDINNQNPAYLCGRLLAELENIQKLAINPKSTIVERYYGTASASPATVFGHLLKGAQAHLAKLRKEKPGLELVLQKRLEQIQSQLTAFPKVLNMEEQAYFALGYYHQRASGWKNSDVGGMDND